MEEGRFFQWFVADNDLEKNLNKFFLRVLFALLNFRLFRLATKPFVKSLRPIKDILVKIENYKMYANTLDRIIVLYLWKFSILESYESRIIKKIIKKGMIVLDIGANIGYYTVQAATLVGSKGKVFAFEPELENYSLLVKNIKANSYNNIIPVQKAVSDKAGKTNLFLCEENKGDHRIFDSDVDRNSIEVETTRLDDFFPDNEHIDVIKMDIQGSEYLALLGMERIIKRNKRLIIISEFSPYLLKRCGFSAEQFLNLIINLGFKLQYINEKKRRIESATPDNLIKMCDENKLYDYVSLYLENI
ncbi:hypothetical protein LCGC14_1068770 [marine sediment metagenome]|uniref:Methyltransferase FkbM domain-containing protein n=1 Tax=marine sediment metagenome TaxID=412755 RepID=A0A0F9MIZ5_9ZZZZ